jgi:hypothetical protein
VDELVQQMLRDVGSLDLQPGTVTVVKVIHDDACALLAGGHQCTCRPEVEVKKP